MFLSYIKIKKQILDHQSLGNQGFVVLCFCAKMAIVICQSCYRGNRIHWTNRGAAYDQKYTGGFPSRPYIIDPANPFNNVYITGIGHYDAGSPEGTYENGDGNWTLFVRNIASLDLSQLAA